MSSFAHYLGRNKMDIQPHQSDGVKWCVGIETDGVILDGQLVKSGILADEMGLGKTIQMIGLMLTNFKLHTLIVLPRALLEQWETILVTTLGHHPLVYHGTGAKKITEQMLKDAPIVLTTYGMLSLTSEKRRLDLLLKFGTLHSIEWDRIIFDEAHHLRNYGTIAHAAAQRIRATHKWLVTGTPMQNSVCDFYSLCDVIGLSPTVYMRNGNSQKIVLKRTKRDAGIVLPKLMRTNITVKWETIQEKRLAEDIHAGLTFNGSATVRESNAFLESNMHHFTKMHLARQSCVDSSLMMKSLTKLTNEGVVLDPTYEVGYQSKINKVIETICERKDNGSAKLVFCHYRAEIDNIKKRLADAGLNVSTFDGRTTHQERRDIISRRDLSALVLQINTGCEGLNLQHFNEVYFVSPHWNPAVEDQAIARSYRIGQSKPVTVFSFKMESFDEGHLNQSSDLYVKQIQRIKRVNIDLNYSAGPDTETGPELLDEDGEPDKCAICLGEQHKYTHTKLECGHCFHVGCISSWFNRSSTCPTCRQ